MKQLVNMILTRSFIFITRQDRSVTYNNTSFLTYSRVNVLAPDIAEWYRSSYTFAIERHWFTYPLAFAAARSCLVHHGVLRATIMARIEFEQTSPSTSPNSKTKWQEDDYIAQNRVAKTYSKFILQPKCTPPTKKIE